MRERERERWRERETERDRDRERETERERDKGANGGFLIIRVSDLLMEREVQKGSFHNNSDNF